jgi:hypothetical protein
MIFLSERENVCAKSIPCAAKQPVLIQKAPYGRGNTGWPQQPQQRRIGRCAMSRGSRVGETKQRDTKAMDERGQTEEFLFL